MNPSNPQPRASPCSHGIAVDRDRAAVVLAHADSLFIHDAEVDAPVEVAALAGLLAIADRAGRVLATPRPYSNRAPTALQPRASPASQPARYAAIAFVRSRATPLPSSYISPTHA